MYAFVAFLKRPLKHDASDQFSLSDHYAESKCKTMRIHYFVACLLVLLLGACQQEAPSASSASPASVQPEATLSSTNTGEQITLDLLSDQSPLSLSEASETEAKALDFDYSPARGGMHLVLDPTKDTYTVLMILRARGTNHFVYSINEWQHLKSQRKLYIHETQITLPAGVSYSAHTWDAMLLLLPDGFTEKQLKDAGYKLPYQSIIATGAPIDITQAHRLTMDIPYATAWTELTKQQHAVSGNEFTSRAFRFKPVGVVVTYSLTNNMDQPISMTGIRVVSNAVVPSAKLDLQNATALSAAVESAGVKFVDYGALYTDQTFDYNLPITNLIPGQKSSLGLVVWYPTTEAVTRTTFDYNDGTPATDLTGYVQYPGVSMSGDPQVAARYATTHVYALGATQGGTPITKPNLQIVPIMGTDRQLASGKSYVIPCELYEQPELQLGYFAKSPLALTSRAGQSQFTLANAVTLSNDNIPMMDLENELQNFVDLSDRTNPTMHPIEIDGVDYMLPDNALMRASGLLSTNALFFRNYRFGGFGSSQPSVGDGRSVYLDRDLRHIDNGQISAPEPSAIITYPDFDEHASTSLMFRSRDLSSHLGTPVRNIHQAVYRIQANEDPSRSVAGTPPYVASLDIYAVYLGKYYVGDLKPFITASLWPKGASTGNASFMRNSVHRRFYVGGAYRSTVVTDATTGAKRIQVAYPFQRSIQGELGAYWTLDAYQYTTDAAYGWYHASPVVGAWGFFGDDKSTWEEIWGRWTYRVAHPYSTTYQGD